MIISGLHWFVATGIAVALHLVGMMWLTLGEPVRQLQPQPASEGIVVNLGPNARSSGESPSLVDPDAGTPVADAEALQPERVDPSPAAATRVDDAAEPAPEAARSRGAELVAAPEPETAATRSVSGAEAAAPRAATPEAAGVEAVETEDVGAAARVEPRAQAREAVPVELADAAAIPEAQDAAAAPAGEAPDVRAAPSAAGSTPAEPASHPSSAEVAPSRSRVAEPVMEPPAVDVAPVAEDDEVEAAAARQPEPEVEQASVPESSEAAAPETVKLRELQQSAGDGSGVVARYAGVIKGWLQKSMHYPRAARLAGQEGEAVIRFIIDRQGRVQYIELESGSGFSLLDREAREMVERGDPFPAMPEEMPGERLEVRVPVSFYVEDENRTKEIPPIYLD